jgi:PleD family two-component response regulator
LALIVSADEWWAGSLSSVLEPAGYRVAVAETGADAQAQARASQPAAILIATPLPDIEGLELCRALRQDPSIRRAVPIIGITSEAITRKQRLSWLQAGAWDFFGLSFERDELLAKLRVYLGAKRDADDVRAGSLVDTATGFYNGRGLQRRADELVATAVRAHSALACVVFGTTVRAASREDTPTAGASAVRGRIGSLLRTFGRHSDTIGWWDDGAFAVLAPGTDSNGAALLARRLTQAMETASPEPGARAPAFELRVGYEAVADLHATPLRADDLLARATTALALARRGADGPRIRRFEAAP